MQPTLVTQAKCKFQHNYQILNMICFENQCIENSLLCSHCAYQHHQRHQVIPIETFFTQKLSQLYLGDAVSQDLRRHLLEMKGKLEQAMYKFHGNLVELLQQIKNCVSDQFVPYIESCDRCTPQKYVQELQKNLTQKNVTKVLRNLSIVRSKQHINNLQFFNETYAKYRNIISKMEQCLNICQMQVRQLSVSSLRPPQQSKEEQYPHQSHTSQNKPPKTEQIPQKACHPKILINLLSDFSDENLSQEPSSATLNQAIRERSRDKTRERKNARKTVDNRVKLQKEQKPNTGQFRKEVIKKICEQYSWQSKERGSEQGVGVVTDSLTKYRQKMTNQALQKMSITQNPVITQKQSNLHVQQRQYSSRIQQSPSQSKSIHTRQNIDKQSQNNITAKFAVEYKPNPVHNSRYTYMMKAPWNYPQDQLKQQFLKYYQDSSQPQIISHRRIGQDCHSQFLLYFMQEFNWGSQEDLKDFSNEIRQFMRVINYGNSGL